MISTFPKSLFALLLALGAPGAFAGVPDCGGEGQRSCTLGDTERYLIGPCEADLKDVNGICVDRNRTNLPVNTEWLGWAMNAQRTGIGGNTPINFITTIGAHNAFSNVIQGFATSVLDMQLTNQYFTITDFLNAGVRFMELDPHWYLNTLVVCHNQGDDCLPTSHFRYVPHLLIEIENWLKAHPDEVLVIKFDDHLQGHERELLQAIQIYMPNRLFSRGSNPSRPWPSISEVRSQGNNVVAFLRNTHPINQYFWDGTSSFVTGNDHPSDFSFSTCTDGDFNSTTRRTGNRWAAIAEGRSMTNIFDTTGLMYESDVVRATQCGVTTIGLDFLLALDKPFVASYSRTSPPDQRLLASIWSWAPGDYGTGSPLLKAVDNRWHSTNPNEAHRYACSLITPNYYFNELNWKVTGMAGPWNQGDAICKSEFGATYKFAYPVNGFQNFQLTFAAGTNDVWLAYNPAGVTFSPLSVLPVSLALRYAPGSALPAPTVMNVYGPPATPLAAKAAGNAAWLKPTLAAPQTDANGATTIAVGLTGAASLLSPGRYTSSFTVQDSATGKSIIVPVTLDVLGQSTITLSPDFNPVIEGPASFVVRVAQADATKFSGGAISLKAIYSSSNPPFVAELQTAAVPTAPDIAIKVGLTHPFSYGSYQLVATYDGGLNHAPVTSPVVTFTVNPRITSNPAALSLRYVRGGALPSQNVVVSGGNGTLAYTVYGASWATVTNATNAGFTLSVNSRAATMAPGAYSGTVGMKDTGAGSQMPLDLTVVVPFQASAAQAALVTAGKPVGSAVQILNTDPLPLSLSTSHSWLNAQLSTAVSPATIQISVDGALLNPGQTYSGSITLSSPFAAQDLTIPVTVASVRPTTVDTMPAGLTYTVDGQSYTGASSFAWAPGSVHAVVAAPFLTSPGKRFRFLNWSDGATATRSVTGSLNGGNFVANYQLEYSLGTAITPAGSGTVSASPLSPDGYYAAGTPVTLTASPASGYVFKNYTGSASGTNAILPVTMDGSKQITAVFANQQAIQFAITANAAGAMAVVDGTQVALPVTLSWLPGSAHTLSVPSPLNLDATSRLVFQSWSDGSSNSHNRTAPSADGGLQLNVATQYLVTVSGSPQAGGSTTGGGWFARGSSAQVTAAPLTGYAFSGFSGSVTSSANPLALTVNSPLNLIANFSATGTPSIYASTTQARTDGAAPDQRLVPIQLTNGGAGLAGNVQITGITGIIVAIGSGNVAVTSPLPVSLGNLAASQSASATLSFQWPATASRVRFTVSFTANGGTYQGSTTLTLAR